MKECRLTRSLDTWRPNSFDFRHAADLSESLEVLLRHIFNRPKFKPPALGDTPAFDVEDAIVWDLGQSTTLPSATPVAVSFGQPPKGRVDRQPLAVSSVRGNTKNSHANVFMSCPSGEQFFPRLRALLFSVVACGFRPRSVMEPSADEELRLERIFSVISGCRFAIFHLSSPASELLTLNFAFELGMFQALQRFGPPLGGRRQSLVLIDEQFTVQRIFSDFSGMDTHRLDADPYRLIRVVRNWLSAASGRRDVPPASSLVHQFDEFMSELPQLLKKMSLENEALPQFRDFTMLASEWLRSAN